VNTPAYEPTTDRIRVLADLMLDAYVDWRVTAAVVAARYRSWSNSPRSDRSIRYASYLAALDGEEQAAQNYARQIRALANALAHEATLTQSRSAEPRQLDAPHVPAVSTERSRSLRLWRH
jgi:hypothetical protein